MKVSEVMTRDVQLIEPTQTIRDAAKLMAELDAGIMPVREGDRLVGMITDRDIAVRAVAEGKGPDTSIREVMTEDVKYCYEDDDTAGCRPQHGRHSGPPPAGAHPREAPGRHHLARRHGRVG